MIVLAVVLACAAKHRVEPTDPPGPAVPFTVLFGTAPSHPSWVKATVDERVVRVGVDVVTSEEAWKSLPASQYWESELSWSPDWETVSVLIARTTCNIGNHLVITDVWDIGEGALQVDVTFHRAQMEFQTITQEYAVATVPRGEYLATANVTVLSYHTQPAERRRAQRKLR